MPFDDGNKVSVLGMDAPDYSQDLKRYTEQVEVISIQIKAAQQTLADLNKQIADATKQRQAAYDLQIKDLDQQIADKTTQLQTMQNNHADWVTKIQVRQAQHDNIVLNFTQQQRVLDDAWGSFRLNNDSMAKQLVKLKADQATLLDHQNQLVIDRQKFEDSKAVQLDQINQMIIDAQNREHDAANRSAEAEMKAHLAETEAVSVTAKQKELDDKVAAAQITLDQADAVRQQKAQNESDAKNNAQTATQNQQDYNQIQVARVALNNQQQQYNSRMATLQLAEAALKGGS